MLSRRSHTKSRLGCLECKRRKVKCDEQKPACAQCTRRQLQCEYDAAHQTRKRTRRRELSSTPPLTQSRRSTSTEPQSSRTTPRPYSSAEVPTTKEPNTSTLLNSLQSDQSGNAGINTHHGPNLDKLDLWIFYTLLTSLPAEMKSTPESNSLQFWTKILPSLAFEHDFILHLALALAAQFMVRHQRVDKASAVSLRASEHYQLALPSFIRKLGDTHDVQVLWIGSLLMCLHCFASAPRPGQYLMFSDAGDSEWNTLFKGARKVWELASSSAPAGERPTPSSYDTTPHPDVETPNQVGTSCLQDHASFFDWLRRFRELLVTLTVEEPSYEKYIEALDTLELCYVEQYGAPDGYDKPVKVATHSTFAWLFRISDEFIAALQLKKSIALVIFAFYVPILHDGKPKWLMQDWPLHILSGIEKHLHPHYSRWLSWVLQYTGHSTANHAND